MSTNRTCICFAYFADGKFIGWYADTFGSVRPNSPKIYSNSEKQIEVIHKNFTNKIKEVNKRTVDDVLAEVGRSVLTESDERVLRNNQILGVVGVLKHVNEDMLAGKEVELRIVECPIYDGPNPNFNREEYDKLANEYRDRLKDYLHKNGVSWDSGPSLRRSELVKEFETINTRPKCDNWVYADYSKVKEWASAEPTEFISTLKPDHE